MFRLQKGNCQFKVHKLPGKIYMSQKLIMKPKNAYLFIKLVFILTMHNQSVILQQSTLQRFQVIADIDLFYTGINNSQTVSQSIPTQNQSEWVQSICHGKN